MRQNEFKFRVNWGDTDMAGIAYYPNFFKWFDIAGHQFFRSAGLPPAQLEEQEQVILPSSTWRGPSKKQSIMTRF